MANRSYLYAIDRIPTSHDDRPEIIIGLSEWPYAIPRSYRILASGNPVSCPSLIVEGAETRSGLPSKVPAVVGEFEIGFRRFQKFSRLLRLVVKESNPDLLERLDETERFLSENQARYVLMETFELDDMDDGAADDPHHFERNVAIEAENCAHVGAAVDRLSDIDSLGATQLESAVKATGNAWGLDGLRLDHTFDNIELSDDAIGLEFSTVLYYRPATRSESDAQ